MAKLRLRHYFLVCLAAASAAPAPFPGTSGEPSSTPEAIIQRAESCYTANTEAFVHNNHGKCTKDKLVYRQAWDDMSTAQRQSYVDAVKCLTTIPGRTPRELAPGVRTLYDDFVYAHLNQTNFIHQSGLFLPWHRQYIWAYEQTLRNECGYTGYLPYWAWERHSANQSLSPVFSGDSASFGGDGKYVPHGDRSIETIGVEPQFIAPPLPPGSGGGCIQDGAFVDLVIHLGPVTPPSSPSDPWGLDYNPRCITRDFHQFLSALNLTYEAIAGLYEMETIQEFRPVIGNSVHIMSHNFIGGDGLDLYTSPNDPVFFLLHAQVDRIWSVWQGQDYSSREEALDGTVTFLNRPPSANATLSTTMHMGLPAGGDLPISHAMSTVGNDYCYIYV